MCQSQGNITARVVYGLIASNRRRVGACCITPHKRWALRCPLMASIIHSEDNAGGNSVCGKKDMGDVTTDINPVALGQPELEGFVVAPCIDREETE